MSENLYTQKISIQDEMPRLSAQANLLKLLLDPFLDSISFDKESGLALDAGAGPGVLTSFLMKKNPNLHWSACDISEEMVQYCKLGYPKVDWKVSDVRALDYPDNHFDFIFNSMVLIHIKEPEKALKEFYRVLKPGGKVLIHCPNDKSFTGPKVLLDMVAKHATIHPADRFVMEKVPGIMEQLGFHLVTRTDFVASNDGNDDKPLVDYPKIHLGMMTGWSMMSFMGHPEGMQDLYSRLQSEYMSNRVKFTINLETHLYQK
ncbi:class I SAM-dependent methyltransferase [Leptospira bandrabouensis]|nr:class I SAM-dependent methyltransferase [Leptospira bandrabouensis]MCG6144394.1 class I SAM-dependent methyltransferase [Leptospira bandrabouensis]MCG6150595.1 class I SAM-dependent methyltransferase [Leptospira bandrabouensis]MCG6160055.1 class I SAM-dependent methyltransferase [Leptospira bandrabouensis]MCG6163988.1 class I SAM-dependent methyltransferase [Leptospira bandrabouensis]MCW7456903.1 class I SAM-dependent methyltransferase [Leptospira bandrabouensis]